MFMEKTTSIRICEELKENLKIQAKKERRSFNSVVIIALEKYLEECKECWLMYCVYRFLDKENKEFVLTIGDILWIY